MARVAGRSSNLVHLEEKGIPVTIEVDFLHFLNMSGGLPLDPEFFA